MADSKYQPPLAATGWRVHRLVASVYPPVSIFDEIVEPHELETLFEIESMTNDRLREDVGDLSLVPVEDRVTGPGATPIMAAFTHLNPHGGRFTTPAFGAYYAAVDIDTAVEETKHHRAAFLARTNTPPIDIDMRCYVAKLDGDLDDLREGAPPAIYDPDDYSVSQALAARLRAEGSNGLIYNSVRDEGGTCVAVFRPRMLSDCRQERHLTYRWDGDAITVVYEKLAFGSDAD
ncbi:RES family NAD+ phosphorylase [Erythrobacter aureus]|uniref:RES domain-containing protein n=1 Tax=Erythrobacter aureus TaxID=2182384 RepID=A0A345YJA2_9SPHN|nr:RES family NAD+ phosphorylase [Erythrobacter aureus]AXK44004.1 RES domain-containing protein [Erythrobacter aureus]